VPLRAPRHAPRWVALAVLLMPLARAAAPPAQEPFAVAGISRAEAAGFLARLQRSVSDGDAAAVASLTRFPLTVNGRTGAATPAEFLARYQSIFNERVRAAVRNQRLEGMFANWKGIVVGRGEVWITASCAEHSPPGECRDRRILVNSVNNEFPEQP
jgi:hypothetical protein